MFAGNWTFLQKPKKLLQNRYLLLRKCLVQPNQAPLTCKMLINA